MKAFGFVGLLLVLGVAGWLMIGGFGGPASGNGELAQAQAAPSMEAHARAAMAQADLAQLKTAVGSFQAAKGRLPQNLDELKDSGYIESVPPGVIYDPTTGALNQTP